MRNADRKGNTTEDADADSENIKKVKDSSEWKSSNSDNLISRIKKQRKIVKKVGYTSINIMNSNTNNNNSPVIDSAAFSNDSGIVSGRRSMGTKVSNPSTDSNNKKKRKRSNEDEDQDEKDKDVNDDDDDDSEYEPAIKADSGSLLSLWTSNKKSKDAKVKKQKK
ncbi:hypothetical protein B5S32_g4138 [[Candida] boidinii]|nr:hypothetical protein B5S32_g4138 [[Candida] boidinii]